VELLLCASILASGTNHKEIVKLVLHGSGNSYQGKYFAHLLSAERTVVNFCDAGPTVKILAISMQNRINKWSSKWNR